MAIQKFENALKLIECRMFKKANEDLEKVIDSAEKALRFMEAKRNNEKRIPLEVFKECMNAQKMILFSKILINSYDDKKNTYLPYFAMPENESNYLESETQDIADKSMKMMCHLNVMERTWILTKSVNIQRKDEAQDCLDKILKGAYPYISRRNKWTQVGTEIDPVAETQWITVMPRYVPVGIEDKVKLVIGVVTKDGDPRGFVCIHIWREDLCIYVEHGDKRTAWIFDAAFGKMKVNVLLDRKHLNVFEDDYNQGENARNYAKEKNHEVERKGFVASDAKREFHTLISSFQGRFFMSNSSFFLVYFSTLWGMPRRDWLQVGVGGEPEVPRGLLRVLHVPGEAGGGILCAGGQELLSAVQVSRSGKEACLQLSLCVETRQSHGATSAASP